MTLGSGIPTPDKSIASVSSLIYSKENFCKGNTLTNILVADVQTGEMVSRVASRLNKVTYQGRGKLRSRICAALDHRWGMSTRMPHEKGKKRQGEGLSVHTHTSTTQGPTRTHCACDQPFSMMTRLEVRTL